MIIKLFRNDNKNKRFDLVYFSFFYSLLKQFFTHTSHHNKNNMDFPLKHAIFVLTIISFAKLIQIEPFRSGFTLSAFCVNQIQWKNQKWNYFQEKNMKLHWNQCESKKLIANITNKASNKTNWTKWLMCFSWFLLACNATFVCNVPKKKSFKIMRKL